MSIKFFATREIQVVKTGKIELQRVEIDVFLTSPTETSIILYASDPKSAYIDCVLSRLDFDGKEPVFSEDDPFCLRDPIGFEVYNIGRDHVDSFSAICAELEVDGYTIGCEAQ